MTQNFRCPVCKSLLELTGTIDFSAPALQEIICPVCGAKLWVSSGYPLPRIWSVSKVLERGKNYPAWHDVVKRAPALDKTLDKESQKPVYQFKLPTPFQEVGKGIYNIGIWIVVVLILILLIKWRK